jgi:hypothetical protein
MDIDSIPLGVKPTNQMNFEQLIEEKLKIADQLDMEQARLKRNGKSKSTSASNRARAVAPQNDENYSSESSYNYYENDGANDSNNEEMQQQQEDIENDEEGNTNVPREPKKFLKKGEGLKKYMPKPRPKKNANASKQQTAKSNGTAPLRSVSTNCIRATTTTTSRLSTGTTAKNNNNTASSANSRKSSVTNTASGKPPPTTALNSKTNVKANSNQQAKPAVTVKSGGNLISASCTNLAASSSSSKIMLNIVTYVRFLENNFAVEGHFLRFIFR